MDFKRYLVKKSVADIQREVGTAKLKRTLGPINLISLGIGCIIGAGIFVITGQAAAEHAGPAIVLSFIFAGLACAFAALCYAELASVLPVSGSAYTYAYASLGEVFAWCMAWLLILEYGVAAATVAAGWSGYLVSFLKDFGLIIPPEWTKAYFGTPIITSAGYTIAPIFNLPAFLGIMVMTFLLVLGVKESANVNNAIVVIKLAVIFAFVGVGIYHIDPANWHPFIPPNTGVDGQFGFSGILTAAGMIFFAYIGFEAVSTAAQEAKNPQKDIPIGILGSLAVCTLLYIIVSTVLTGIVHYSKLNVPDPMAVAVDAIGIAWLAFGVKLGAIMGLTSVMLVLLYGQTRILYQISKDGLLPKFFSEVHKTFQTPHLNTMFVGVVVAVISGLTPISELGKLVSMGTLFAFAVICFSVMYLRVTQPKLVRPFRVPCGPLFPLLGIAFCLYLMWGIREMFFTLKFYFLAGLLLYFFYGANHSKKEIQVAKKQATKAKRAPAKKKKRK